jgi:hypothetical protein
VPSNVSFGSNSRPSGRRIVASAAEGKAAETTL